VIPVVLPTYARADVAFDRGEGAWLYDTKGRKYLDFASGVAVTSLGHAHPHLVEALTEQAKKLWHCSNLFQIPGQTRLAERLVASTFADTVFFCNSGAEALEGAIKTVRKYHSHMGHPEKFRIIGFEGSFHGRTLATLAAAGNPKYINGFGPPVDGFDHVAFNNLNELRAAITPQTGGILVEPVQGEGGVRPADPDFLKGLRTVADEFGLLLIFDEVQSGNGRTGKFFAHEWSGITPDVMAIAKGIGSGFPMGAFLATEKAAQGMVAGTHGSTFGGNPLAMAVGNAVLDVLLEPGFLDKVQRMAARLLERLQFVQKKYPHVYSEVRGHGLLLGIKCGPPSAEVGNKLREEGMLTAGAGDNVVRLLPPLIIGKAEIDAAEVIVDKVGREWPKS
jgi:acetylornithine/N-succinyldiaminopimelate aminotransferase